MESLWKGVSRMDAARGVKGQGRPLYAGPWNNDGAREPDEVGPDARGKTFCLLLGRLPKVSRRKGGTVRPNSTQAADTHKPKNRPQTKSQCANYGALPPIRSKVEPTLFKEEAWPPNPAHLGSRSTLPC